MERLRIHRLVVVDESDVTFPIGVLSLTDIVHSIALDDERMPQPAGTSTGDD
jgi:CBS domain-containing protein